MLWIRRKSTADGVTTYFRQNSLRDVSASVVQWTRHRRRHCATQPGRDLERDSSEQDWRLIDKYVPRTDEWSHCRRRLDTPFWFSCGSLLPAIASCRSLYEQNCHAKLSGDRDRSSRSLVRRNNNIVPWKSELYNVCSRCNWHYHMRSMGEPQNKRRYTPPNARCSTIPYSLSQ
jgi:hypothetical protein